MGGSGGRAQRLPPQQREGRVPVRRMPVSQGCLLGSRWEVEKKNTGVGKKQWGFKRKGRGVRKLDDEWPESIFHHVGNQSASYPVSV